MNDLHNKDVSRMFCQKEIKKKKKNQKCAGLISGQVQIILSAVVFIRKI